MCFVRQFGYGFYKKLRSGSIFWKREVNLLGSPDSCTPYFILISDRYNSLGGKKRKKKKKEEEEDGPLLSW